MLVIMPHPLFPLFCPFSYFLFCALPIILPLSLSPFFFTYSFLVSLSYYPGLSLFASLCPTYYIATHTHILLPLVIMLLHTPPSSIFMPYLSSTTYPHSFFIFYFIFSILLPHAPFSLSTSLCPPYPCTHTHTHTYSLSPFFCPFPLFSCCHTQPLSSFTYTKGTKRKGKKNLICSA